MAKFMDEEYFRNIDGRKEATAYIVNNLLEEGISMDLIKKVTGMEKHEIRDLLREQEIKDRAAARLNLMEELFGLSPEEVAEMDKKKRETKYSPG